jgi:uncharacterized protein
MNKFKEIVDQLLFAVIGCRIDCMIENFEIIEKEITQRLKQLNPEKIILFGSYAYGTPNEDSDIDICIIKNLPRSRAREYTNKARKNLRDLVFKYKVGFDIITVPKNFIQSRCDPFYREDILIRGKEIYAE